MVKIKPKHKKNKKDKIVNAINFSKDTVFFFDVTKIYPCINGINDLTKLNAESNEIEKLNMKLLIS